MQRITPYLLYADDDRALKWPRAKKAGAKILEPPADQFYGERRYGAADPEGHQWYFAQPLPKKARRPA